MPDPFSTRGRGPAPAGLLLVAAVWLGAGCAGTRAGERTGGPPAIGGCRTESREYGLPAFTDSLAEATVRALLTPRRDSASPDEVHGRVPPGAAPLFLQIGAVDCPADSTWRGIAGQVTDRIQAAGISLARRSALRETSGPCFPPFHVDFEAWAESTLVAAFLDSLVAWSWPGFHRTGVRAERDLFITAGMSLQQMDRVVDLRHAPR